MRIKCQIKVLNRCNNGIGNNGGSAAQAMIYLAGKCASSMCFVYCTAKNKDGMKFPIKDNVLNIFTRFIKEGKATVQLKDPPFDIFVSKAQVNELKTLLNALKLAAKGQSLNKGVLSSFAPAKLKHVQKPVTKLLVNSRKDYPVTSNFPSTLHTLVVNECLLARFDTRIFSLRQLTSLNLSCNRIKQIPDDLARMNCLKELILSKNQVEEFPNSLCLPTSKLCDTLLILKIDSNNLTCLPRDFCNLKKLIELDLSFNQITGLPVYLGLHLVKLHTLCVSYNCIRFLSSSLYLLPRIERLDFFKNPFISEEMLPLLNQNFTEPCEIPSLLQLSARVIKSDKVFYHDKKSVPHSLIRYLDNAVPCFCTNPCFDDSATSFIFTDLRRLCENATSLDESGQFMCPFRVTLCSKRCKLHLI